jgi:hypothetical protein
MIKAIERIRETLKFPRIYSIVRPFGVEDKEHQLEGDAPDQPIMEISKSKEDVLMTLDAIALGVLEADTDFIIPERKSRAPSVSLEEKPSVSRIEIDSETLPEANSNQENDFLNRYMCWRGCRCDGRKGCQIL